MSTALVVRTQRHKKIGDSNSPMVHTLKRKPQDAKIFDLARIAQDIEALGAMSAEDVEHVGKAIVRQMRQTLTDGNSVRLDGFGIFHTTFKCRATEVAKDCTVKNIERVNIRFKVANTLRLVNDSNATTKGGANNLVFELVSEDITAPEAVPATTPPVVEVRTETRGRIRWDKKEGVRIRN